MDYINQDQSEAHFHMLTDIYGNEVTCDNPEIITGINGFITGYLSYTPVITEVFETAEAHPNSCLANAYSAFLWLFLESPEGPVKAQPFVDRAIKASHDASQREKWIAHIAQAWVHDDIPTVLELFEKILRANPRDLASLKLAQYHLFNKGDALDMLRLANLCYDASTDISYMHGMAAFAYEQCHLLDDAEKAAHRALDLNSDEPWAHHALAHVFLTQGRIDEGCEFLESVSANWAGLNSFMYTHNWWHLAVMYINRGRMDEALEIYDKHVWAREKDYSQDQVGAVSMLSRLELAGVDVGDRWQDVATYIAARGEDTTLPFMTMQYLLGLCKAQRPEAMVLMDAIRTKAEAEIKTMDASAAHPWNDVALPVCEAILALEDGKYSQAAKLLGRALPRLSEIGGSHAQRDLFEQLYLDALMKSQQWSKAQQLLETRRAYDPISIPINRELSKLYARSGLTRQADIAAERTQPSPVGEALHV
jgi:tetratricopeptide (TPR) repeat protein